MRTYNLFPALVFVVIASAPAFGQAATDQTLTLRQAEGIAIQNHPQIQIASDLASAASAQVTEARSAYYPTVYGSATGVDAEHNSRIAAGALNNPIVFERFAEGVTVNQMVTDFGRTHELVKSSKERADAQRENVVTSRADVLLAVDQAFYGVLRAKALLAVGEQTVKERQLVADQIGELAKNKIRSGLDASFANVNLAQAQLLLIQGQNDLQSSFAELSAALGYSTPGTFQLVEQDVSPAPPADSDDAIAQALKNRPELIGLRLEAQSAHSYATAERDLWFPTISAVGVAGLVPFNGTELSPRYAAGGVNLNIPIFNGHLYGALRSEANSRARAEDQSLRDLQDRVARDVRTAWLNANSAFQRLAVTRQFLDQANMALDLAQSRYQLGLSSIVELSQAQLNQTQAQIAAATAKYDYALDLRALEFQIGNLH